MHLHALKLAMSEYESSLAAKGHNLGLKATAWLAGFPVINSEVWLAQPGEEDDFVRDFLGPSIDLGFRLTRFADGRRIPVSVDLAYLLAKSANHVSEELKPTILFGSSESLKGVMDGKKYPVLWVDRLDGTQTSEDVLRCIERRCDYGAICRFADDLFEREGNPCLERPFIEDDDDEDIRKVPDYMRSRRKEIEVADADRSYENAESSAADDTAGDVD